MNKLFVAVAVAGVATILVFINAYARDDAFDSKGNLFVGDAYSGTIFKFTPDGKKSMFASGLMPDDVYDLAFDRTGNLLVWDEENELGLKVTRQGTKTTYCTAVGPKTRVCDNS